MLHVYDDGYSEEVNPDDYAGCEDWEEYGEYEEEEEEE